MVPLNRSFRHGAQGAALLATLLLAGCVTVPAPLQGEYSPAYPSESAERGVPGERVRWGGQVVGIHNGKSDSCFEVVGKVMGSDGRPQVHDRSEGRFIACRAGFYDPAVFKPGRELTIVGTVNRYETHRIDDFDYRYPIVMADVVYLWPERKDVDVIVEHGWYSWWW